MKRNAIALLLLIFSLFCLKSFAQNSFYFMERMPQTLNYNPALVPDIGFYLKLPGISMAQADVYNSGFSFGDFDKFMTRLEDDSYDPEDFVRQIGASNQTYAETNVNLLGFGFRLSNKGYLSLSFTQRNTVELAAPSNVIYLVYSAANDNLDYLDQRLPIEIRGLDVRLNLFSQLAITYSRKIGDNLTLGFSPKLVGAIGAFQSDNLNARLSRELVNEEFGDYYDYQVEYSGTALVGVPVAVNPAAIGANNVLNEDADLLPENWFEGFGPNTMFQNPGWAFDLGVNYNLNERWSFSASLLDLGSASWKKHGYKMEFNQESVRIFDDQAFRMKIPAKLYAAAAYSLSRRWNAGFLMRNVFYDSEGFTSATVSLNGYLGSLLSSTFSYTISDTYNNLGVGLRLRVLPGADMFAVTDNVLQLINYRESRHATVAFGLNMSFGVR